MKRLRSQSGFTLVEVLTAATLTTVGIAATIGVFGSTHRTSLQSERREVAVQQAQAAIDRMLLMDYNDLALSTQPAYSSDPNSPFNRVSADGTQLTVKSGLSEDLIVDTNAGQVFVGPERFSVGTGGSKVEGYLYRFITWRDENCPNNACDGSQNTKRLTVAVTVDASGTLSQPPPLWISSVTADPDAAPPGSDLPPDANPGNGNSLAETFYLYDTRCSSTQRGTITASHSTHNTASQGTVTDTGNYSTCENVDPTKRPDLMGSTAPPGDSSTTLYTYSSDLTGTYPGGLAMKQFGADCPTTYDSADASNTSAHNMWNVHAWASNAMTSTFTLSKRLVVNLYTQSMGGVTGRGMVCATVLSRSTSGGVPTDTVVSTTTYDNPSWPTAPTPVTFSWDLPSAVNVSSGDRLMLVISVREESDNDLVMLYDHPLYKSFLQVETTTPLP